MRLVKLASNKKGETIIEVMIALTILGLVLGFSFVSASRSLRASQDAQERTVASQHAMSLLEAIKFYAVKAEGDPALAAFIFPSTDRSICLSTALDDINDTDLSKKVSAHPNDMCSRGLYSTRVDVHPITGSVPQTYEYAATVNWESLAVGSNSTAIMRYKWVRIPITP